MSNNQDNIERPLLDDKKQLDAKYQAARDRILNKIVPEEEQESPSCMWRLCCCSYYLFCCCLCETNKTITRHNFVKRFEKWLNLDKLRKGQRDKKMSVIKNLMRLYAHQTEAVKDLEKCRVNPDFTSAFRNDLEFFIPQICSFFLKGDFQHPQELHNLIILASSASFFYAHRVWFFFQSAMYQDFSQEIYQKYSNCLFDNDCVGHARY